MSDNEKIVLIDMGDDVVWCDSVPSDEIAPEDVTEYYRADYVESLQSQVDKLQGDIKAAKAENSNYQSLWFFMEAMCTRFKVEHYDPDNTLGNEKDVG
jgi:hypothetical protein